MYQIYFDRKRQKLLVIYSPHRIPDDVDVLYYIFYDGVEEGTANQTYLDNNCDLVLECEGELNAIAEELKEMLQ